MTNTNSKIAAMARRSRNAVRTVVNSDHGRAACASHVTLFERVEHNEGDVSYANRLQAAAVCNGCPLRLQCGFRVTGSGNRRKGNR